MKSASNTCRGLARFLWNEAWKPNKGRWQGYAIVIGPFAKGDSTSVCKRSDGVMVRVRVRVRARLRVRVRARLRVRVRARLRVRVRARLRHVNNANFFCVVLCCVAFACLVVLCLILSSLALSLFVLSCFVLLGPPTPPHTTHPTPST